MGLSFIDIKQFIITSFPLDSYEDWETVEMSLNYSPQSFCPIYPCHSPEFTGGQTGASRFRVLVSVRKPLVGLWVWTIPGPSPVWVSGLKTPLPSGLSHIIHKKNQTLHCSCCFLQISFPWRCLIQMQSQARTTGLGSSQMWLTSLVWVVPLGFFTIVQINVCNWRIKALGCEKWRNHSLRYYICSFFVGGFVLIVN